MDSQVFQSSSLQTARPHPRNMHRGHAHTSAADVCMGQSSRYRGKFATTIALPPLMVFIDMFVLKQLNTQCVLR
jgi:hypothetical protein